MSEFANLGYIQNLVRNLVGSEYTTAAATALRLFQEESLSVGRLLGDGPEGSFFRDLGMAALMYSVTKQGVKPAPPLGPH